MSERALKRCLIAADVPHGPWLHVVQLPAEATIGAALVLARRAASAEAGPPIDWEGAAVGLWGVRCSRDAVPVDGDRIEVYRPLAADPRQRRREQVRAARRKWP